MVEDKGVRLLIDPKAVLFLLGTEMDYKTDKLSVAIRVQQSEPDLGLRLRRIGGADGGERNGFVRGCSPCKGATFGRSSGVI